MKTLYMVSLGPGDPELLTLKAYSTLKHSDAIAIPCRIPEKLDSSRAYEIICAAMDESILGQKMLVPMLSPMQLKEEDWEIQTQTLLELLEKYGTVSYVTLGDAGVYSSVYYLIRILGKKYPETLSLTEVVPGVTSYSHASAKLKHPLCLGGERLVVQPYGCEKAPATIVTMRPEKGVELEMPEAFHERYMIEKLNFGGEVLRRGNHPVREYLTLIIDFLRRG